MRRKLHLKAVAVLSALALVAACGGEEEPEETPPAADTSDPAETTDDSEETTGDAEETTGDGAGESAAPPAAEAPSEFTLGYVLPETGALAFLGPPQIEAVNLAISDINAAGGVLGAEVPDPIPGDEGDQASVAQASADRILSQGVSGIVGAAASARSLDILDRVTGAGVMMCSGSNTAPTFTDQIEDNGLYVRTAPSDALQGPILANTIINDGWSNIAIAAQADDYGRGLADATAEALENAGATVVVNETFDPAATEFNAVVESLASSGADAYVIIAFEQGVQILQGLIEQGITPADAGIYGADGLRNPDLGSLVNESDPSVLAGMRGTAPASAENQAFLDALAEAAPDLGDNTQFAPQVYDCTVTMALAAEAAGSPDAEVFKEEIVNVTKDGTECTSFEECKGLLEQGEDIDYQGVSGPLDFTDVGEPGRASIEVYGFDDQGQFESLETVESNPEGDM
jgi:branched-chain amino acid transport system substrate-binding protein